MSNKIRIRFAALFIILGLTYALAGIAYNSVVVVVEGALITAMGISVLMGIVIEEDTERDEERERVVTDR